MNYTLEMPKGSAAIIKVIGVGGGGNNALAHMYDKDIPGIDFVICNTDKQTLVKNPVPTKVQLGVNSTEGLGAGADPEVGEKAALESTEDLKQAIGIHTKMVFITAGMGGGTGTGAAPVIAKIAREMGILVVGIVTIPFGFEGRKRSAQAQNGLKKLRENVDSLIVINNDKLADLFADYDYNEGFAKADEILSNAAIGMAEVITRHYDVNVDFHDARSVLQNSGTALMSVGIASGEKKAEEAVKKALDSPLLDDNKIVGAENVLLLVRSGKQSATLREIRTINEYIQSEAGNTANIIFGVGRDESLGDSISVLVIATGFKTDETAQPAEKVVFSLSDSPSQNTVLNAQNFNVVNSNTNFGNEQHNAREVLMLTDDEQDDAEGFSFTPTDNFSFKNTNNHHVQNVQTKPSPVNPTQNLAQRDYLHETSKTDSFFVDEKKVEEGFDGSFFQTSRPVSPMPEPIQTIEPKPTLGERPTQINTNNTPSSSVQDLSSNKIQNTFQSSFQSSQNNIPNNATSQVTHEKNQVVLEPIETPKPAEAPKPSPLDTLSFGSRKSASERDAEERRKRLGGFNTEF